mmetsp:Transcript_88592/g.251123  ORF Transcript_88592/g.251123 Transcript_88592/m.251123 type:complete len:224 (-) Transcript_88592:491-1162(-)
MEGVLRRAHHVGAERVHADHLLPGQHILPDHRRRLRAARPGGPRVWQQPRAAAAQGRRDRPGDGRDRAAQLPGRPQLPGVHIPAGDCRVHVHVLRAPLRGDRAPAHRLVGAARAGAGAVPHDPDGRVRLQRALQREQHLRAARPPVAQAVDAGDGAHLHLLPLCGQRVRGLGLPAVRLRPLAERPVQRAERADIRPEVRDHGGVHRHRLLRLVQHPTLHVHGA